MFAALKGSIRTKLVRMMVALLLIVGGVTLVVVAAMNYVSSRETLSIIESNLRGTIQRKGSDLVESQALALRDLVADNAFGDVGRLVDRTVEQDDRIVYGLFLGPDLKPWRFAYRGAVGQRNPEEWKVLGVDVTGLKNRGVAIRPTTFKGQTAFEFSTPVFDDKAEFSGSVRYAISDRRLREALASAQAAARKALLTAIALLVLLTAGTTWFGMLLARRAAARLTQPISELTTAANALANGRRDIRVSITSGDEVEVLGTTFNRMAGELQDYYARLEDMNRSLEQKVAARTRELGERNRDMRLVLDNVVQGFLTLSPDGQLAQERSAIVDRWFGAYDAGATFTDYIARIDPVFAEYFALGYEALLDNVLPRALCLQQLPTAIRYQGQEFRCTYLPLGQEDDFKGLLIVVNDATAEILAAQYEADRREILATFEGLTRDRAGFLAFIDESDEQVRRLRASDLETQKRLLHTLKGNCSLMGLVVMAGLCHTIEGEVAETGETISDVSLAQVTQRWQELTKALGGFLGEHGRDVVEVPAPEIERLDEQIRARAPQSSLLDRIASWRLESAERPLSRLGHHAHSLASRLGKGDLAVAVEGCEVRLSRKTWAGLWSDLVHVIRNAVDHGIEAPSARETAGKPPRPRLRLGVRVVNRDLIVELEDDGAGIDWPAVKRAAARRGLPSDSEDDLVRAMFSDDVTTRSEVTALSGRGIGLAAVREQVERLGGSVSVKSRRGVGTCFSFKFPLPGIGPQFGVEVPNDAKATGHAVA